MPYARMDEVALEVADLLACDIDEVLLVSGKTGEGVEILLRTIVEKFPAPQKDSTGDARALVFDFSYTNHTGINAFARVFGSTFKKGDRLLLREIDTIFSLKDVGVFKPDMISTESIQEGMIGYFTTGIKEPGIAIVGDTITHARSKAPPFHGYQEAVPVIWVSLYPQDANEYNALHSTLQEMRLTDAAFSYEEERSTALGKGFRCGFLGMLHFEIITERVRRQAGIELIGHCTKH